MARMITDTSEGAQSDVQLDASNDKSAPRF